MNTAMIRVVTPALLLATFSTLAATLYVDVNSTNPVPPYTNWATAANVIQDAVDAASDGDTVLVANGAYLLSAELMVTNNITLRSVNGPTATIIDGGGKVRCLNLGTSACTVSGFTITGGYSVAGYAGGVFCDDEETTITNCVIRANFAHAEGGGMTGGTAIDCLFIGNSAPLGGGMAYGTAQDCLFVGNSANNRGGGMYEGTANNCIFTDNHAFVEGGGVYGGIAKNCTITGNIAGKAGGGTKNITAYNCIAYSNSASVSGNNIENAFYILNSCSPDLVHGVDGNITNAPLLVSIGHIATNSPCRAAGDYAHVTGTDIDGQPWLNPPSMGCDENAGPGNVTGAVTMSLLGPDRIAVGVPSQYTPFFNGPVTGTRVDFGDGQVEVNPFVSIPKVWTTPGIYQVVLTAYNDDHASGVAFTQMVHVVSVPEATLFVSGDTGSNANDGSSWALAKQTIQAGVDAQTVHGGTVLVTNGTYLLSSEILVNKVLRLESANGPEGTLIDGGGVVRCLNLGASACTVSGFTITNGFVEGYYTGDGGGVYCATPDPTVTNCILTGNVANNGGAMQYGTAYNCIIVGNTAMSSGGGLANCRPSHCIITNNTAISAGGGMVWGTANDCTLIHNTAASGGGMHAGTANNCKFIGNSAAVNGGGASSSTTSNCNFTGNSATPDFWDGDGGGGMHRGRANHCTFTENVASRGGGVFETLVSDCIIFGNTADYAGGMYGGVVNGAIAVNSTIVGNFASIDFGGIFAGEARNCIVFFNTSPGSVNDDSGGQRRFCCSPDLVHGVDANITNAPLFVNTNGWADLRLQSNSPCINAGNNAQVTTATDLDGNPRIVGGTVDMGAYEFQSPQSAISYAWLQQYGLPTDGSVDNLDGDNDRATTWQEWKAWTDPINALSVLKLLMPQPGTNGTVVPWQSVAGHSYRIERTTNGTPAFTLLQSGIAGQAGTTSFTDTTATNGSAFLYRVGVPE